MKSTIHHRTARCFAVAALCACFGLMTTENAEAQRGHASRMSGMGQSAQRHMLRLERAVLGSNPNVRAFVGDENEGTGAIGEEEDGGDPLAEDLHTPQDDDFDEDEVTGGQAETSMAIDSTGQHVVVGFNDTRGFSLNPVSVSGFMYSDNGGLTFTDGGQLPVNTGTTNVGATILPQVFGDPEIVYLGGSNFAYVSISVNKLGASGTVQTMCVHTSNDFGHTWKGPWIIPACSNPHGLLSGVNARDAADKEFAHRDPDTGRVMVSWSNFTATTFAPGGVEISRTYSDDLSAAATAAIAPTWSTRLIIGARSIDGQSSIPRFAGNGSADAYIVWRTSTSFFGVGESIAISHDNGVTFGAPSNLRASTFVPMDHVLGNDRTNNSPGFDVDHTGGGNNGNLYVVYTDDNSNDGGDIAFQRSTNGGASWSAVQYIDSRPGSDRTQWFPWVVVDQSTGRVHAFYYDQGTLAGGDTSEVTQTYSDDGGLTWSPPSPITTRPWHAGYGNDTGQPNIGDYNQGVTRLGEFMAVFANAPQTIFFQNGQPAAGMNFPDVAFSRKSSFPVALRLGSTTTTDSSGDGLFEPGETLTILAPVESYANISPTYTGVTGTLTTSTPNVTIVQGNSGYPNVNTLTSSTNSTPFKIKLGAAFVPGTSVELSLAVATAQGPATLLSTIRTGSPVITPIYNNNFDVSVAGWSIAHGGGANTVSWGVANESTRFNVAPYNTGHNSFFFHQNENDGVGGTGNPTRFERLFSPVWVAPADSDYVQVDFDVAYNSEDQPPYNIYAYDGFFVRVTDQTPGFTLRSVLAEAFAYDFTTGGVPHYPKHFPRNSSTAYFEDMSAWAGYSNGWKHVTMKLPGMAGKTFQLRYEFAQDSGGTGHDTHPGYPTSGVAMDNLVVKSVHLVNANHPPVANAGPDMTDECVGTHNYVNLDGGASSDPDAGEPLTYEWFQGATSIGNTAAITVDPPHNQTTTYTLVVTDAHGAQSTDTVDVTITDTIAPQVTLVGSSLMVIPFGSVFVDPGATALDICDGNLTANIVETGSVNTNAVGTYLLTYKATDDAHNTGSAVRTVKVIYEWSNLLQPMNTDGSSIFKLNSTIPLKFNLTGGSAGQVITAHVYLAKVSNNVIGSEQEAVSTSAADTGNTFRQAGDGYIFNLATKGLSVGTWQLRVDLGDGVLHTVLFSLR